MNEMCEENIKNKKESFIIAPYWLRIYMESSCDHNKRVFRTERDRIGKTGREHSQGSFCNNVGGIEMSLFHISFF